MTKKLIVFFSVLFSVVAYGRGANNVYVVPNAGGIPTWSQVNLGSPSAVTGVLPTANGGTNGASPGVSGNVLTSDGTNWTSAIPASQDAPVNFLLNSGFTFWQRGITGTIVNTNRSYQADRWTTTDTLGTGGQITTSRVSGVLDGSKYGAQVQITTAPTALQTNGTEFKQVLENFDSLQLYNKTASFGVQVKALGNVNAVGIQFMYATSEVDTTTGIGSEVSCAVVSGSFTRCVINGQAIGTAMTTAGVVGVRIRILTVSAGNTWDLNNGFAVEQAIVNLGSTIATYKRKNSSYQAEQEQLFRYYENSYPNGNYAGDITYSGSEEWIEPVGQNRNSYNYHVRKRISLNPVLFSPGTGALNTIRDRAVNVDVGAALGDSGSDRNFSLSMGLTAGHHYAFHWVADADF